ncbi:MAG TPA: L-histidine N(alpha)-methyltransferase [Polyangia bacterium]|nr:L-histidine N(alpha)-methyltransferase [Polyangia bacterium]
MTDLADEVRRGLTATPKTLSPRLFYDDEGSRLYELITELPEYYLTRAERSIFEEHAPVIATMAGGNAGASLTVVEIGAGSASKTELVLSAILRRQRECLYVPVDVSRAALDAAARRLSETLPRVRVQPVVGTYERAFPALAKLPAPSLAMFIGSSIGNLDDGEASTLLRGLRRALGPHAALLLGTDLRKAPEVLLPAYDDAAGVTAAFNKNLLARINRELGGHFDLDRFRHVARWNDAASRIEMHLESLVGQDVPIGALGISVHFDAGETIHTESSVKYDFARVGRLLEAGGFSPMTSFTDRERRFAVHLASATP